MTALRRFGLLAPLAALSLAGCGLNSVPTAEEKVNANWGNLQANISAASDLIPNLVETVKGYAQQERTVLDRSDQRSRERRPGPAERERPRAIRPRCGRSTTRRAG